MPTILVVDDEPEVRGMAKTALERAGYALVIEANSGNDALEILRKGGVDFMITDLVMPNMNGLELVSSAFFGKCLPPFMVVSATIDTDTLFEFQAFGGNKFQGYLTKPYHVCELLEKVGAYLSLLEA